MLNGAVVLAVLVLVIVFMLIRLRSLRYDMAGAMQEAQALRLGLARAEEQAAAAARLEAEHQAQRRADAERAEALLADLRAERDSLREALDLERRHVSQRDVSIRELRTTLEKEREHAEEQLALLKSVREDMQLRFQALSEQAVKTQGEALSKASFERLEALLNPFRENVGKFENELRQAHQGAAKERERLKTEIEMLTRKSEQISKEAVNLTRALKGDTRQQGAWGEMVLTTLLERSGLREGEEYELQHHATDESGRRFRPDVLVHLPGGKSLVIDSKVSLLAYERAVNAEDEAGRTAALREHVAALRAHIDGLSRKNYHELAGASVDYVIMFMPIEGALSEALRSQGDLTAYALDRQVTIATPTTLMMALRTIENVWAVEKRTRNAEEIADRAGRLYDKVAGFVESMQEVGKRLEQASSAHATALGRLSQGPGNVIRQVEQLKELGAKTGKSIPIAGDSDDGPPALPDGE